MTAGAVAGPQTHTTHTTRRPYGDRSTYTYNSLPDEVRARRQFVVWRLNTKGKKVPFNPVIDSDTCLNELASSTNPATWGSYEEAVYTLATGIQQRSKAGNLYRVYPDGIGYVFAHNDPYVGIDFDHCIVNEVVAPGVLSLVEHTYCEVSQSGTGVKAIGRASVIAALKTDSVEIYGESRFFALTGRVVPGTSGMIADIQTQVDSLIKLHRPNGQRQRQHDQAAPEQDSTLDWAFIHWLEHNPRRLFRDDGFPHVAMLNCPAAQQLRALLIDGTIPPTLAVYNDTDSERRAVIAHSTSKLGMLPEERYVLLRTLVTRYGWNSQKSLGQLDQDYRRLIFTTYPVLTDRTAQVSRSRYAAFLQEAQPLDLTTIEQPAPTERRPAHRPPGPKAAQVKRLHPMLDDMANDEGVIDGFTTEELALRFNETYPRRRSIGQYAMRDYLRAGRDADLWVMEQAGGNGRLVITLKKRVICHPKPAEPPEFRVTDESVIQSSTTPQTAISQSQCNKEIGENTACVFAAPVRSATEAAPVVEVPAPIIAGDEMQAAAECTHASEQGAATMEGTQQQSSVPPSIEPEVMPSTSGMVLLFTMVRTVIRVTFDHWQAAEKLDRRTGELKRCNVTSRRVVADLWAAGLGLVAPDVIEELIVEERQRRELAAFRAMSFNDLRAELRKAEKSLAVAKRREQPTGWILVRIDKIRAEMRLRPAEPEPVKKQRRKGGPVCPDQRAAALQLEADLLDQVDAVLGRDACDVIDVNGTQRPATDAWRLIGSLFARQPVEEVRSA